MSFDLSHIAVLTGDIVKSTTLTRNQRNALFAALRSGAAAVGALQDEPPRFERFGGDSWQMLATPRFALRASLLMRAHIRQESKAFETRISVGIGAVEPLAPEGLGASDGPAFQASGRGLKALKGGQYFSINTPELPIYILADQISKGWTQAQARVLCKSLTRPHPTQDSLASYLGVSRMTVRNHQIAAGAPALLAVLDMLEGDSSP
jgi:hypothetical protein